MLAARGSSNLKYKLLASFLPRAPGRRRPEEAPVPVRPHADLDVAVDEGHAGQSTGRLAALEIQRALLVVALAVRRGGGASCLVRALARPTSLHREAGGAIAGTGTFSNGLKEPSSNRDHI